MGAGLPCYQFLELAYPLLRSKDGEQFRYVVPLGGGAVLRSLRKKKILFLITGPPIAAPNWFYRSSPFLGRRRARNSPAASNLSFRKNSHPAPWKALVPDLIVALRTAAPDRPYSALKFVVCTLNS